jgi:hypothetical protein
VGNDTSLGFNLIGRDVSASDALDKFSRKAKTVGGDFDAFGKNATGFTNSITKGFLGVGAALGGAFAITNVAQSALQYLQDAATAAIADEKSMVALATAMENVGQGFANAGTEDFIKDLMLATGVADDELRPAFQRLVTATGDAAESQKLLQTALDISAATGKDVVSVSQALAKASTGSLGALTKLGVPLDANIIKTKDFGAAVESLNEKFGGQAAAAAETYGGQLKRVQTAAAEAQETIGYALLGAISDVSDAFGGSGGAVDAVSGFGEATANFVTAVGMMATEVAKLTAAMTANADAGTDWGDRIQTGAHALDVINPVFSDFVDNMVLAVDVGDALTAVEKAKADEIAGVTALYAGYKANSDRAHSATVALTEAAEDEADALARTKDAVTALTAALGNSQSIDDFRKSLADLDTTLKGNKTTFKGMGDAAKENRDTLRSSLGDAAKIAQQWVEDGKISADQYDAAYKGLAKKVVNQFVRDGFKRSDIVEFMGAEGIWTGPAKANLTASQKAALALAYSGFKGVGTDMGRGMAAGIAASSAKVQAMTRQLVLEAEAAARSAAESHSPSQLFYRVGEDLGEGLKLGMAVVWPRIAGDINKGMDELTISIRGKSDEASGAMLQSFANRTDAFKGVIDAQVAKITTARKALDDYAASVTSTILGNVKFQSTGTDAEGKVVPLTPEQIVQMVIGDIANQQAAVGAIAKIATRIPEALAQQMLTMDPKAAIELANYLAARPEQMAQLTTNYQALATATETLLGVPMAKAFATVGDVSAVQMIAKAKARIADEAEDFKRWVRNHLGTEITIRVNYDTSGAPTNLPGRAAGGPVTGGNAYIIGERGPELFVPLSSGTVVPNNRLAAAPAAAGGGNTYQITVQAGVGDPRQIGQQIVEYVKKFEQSNGAGWRSS